MGKIKLDYVLPLVQILHLVLLYQQCHFVYMCVRLGPQVCLVTLIRIYVYRNVQFPTTEIPQAIELAFSNVLTITLRRIQQLLVL